MPHTHQVDNTQLGGVGKTLGIIAIICGGVGICVPGLAVLGLVLGIVGLLQARVGFRRLLKIGTVISGMAVLVNLLLMLLVVSPVWTAAQESKNMQQERKNLSAIGQAYVTYAVDHKYMCPAHASELTAYTGGSTEIFIAPPADPAKATFPPVPDDLTKPHTYGSFTFTPLAGFNLSDVPLQTIIAYSAQPRGVGGLFRSTLFIDGHVEMISEANFSQRLAESNRNLPPDSARRLDYYRH